MSIISLRENKLVIQIFNVIRILNQDFSSFPAGRAEVFAVTGWWYMVNIYVSFIKFDLKGISLFVFALSDYIVVIYKCLDTANLHCELCTTIREQFKNNRM
jgi:hypothetical protein